MSGSIFGQVPQIAVPDFGATAARAQGMQANRLAMMLQQRQMDEADQRQQFFAQNAQGFASPDAGKRMNLLAMLAQQPGGAAMALPMIGQERQRTEFQDIMRGAMGGGAPVTGHPVITPAPTDDGAPNPQWDDRNLPRGIRNNNPLNLSYVQGQPGVQGSDGRFGRYNTPEEGIAASVRQLQMYGQRGLTTPAQIIGRWAPQGENNTGAYVAAVARNAGLDPNQPVNLSDPAVVSRLVGAMAQHENGRPMDSAVVQRGVQMALSGRGGSAPSGDTIPASGPTTGGQSGGANAGREQTIARMEAAVTALTSAGRLEEAARLSTILNGMRRGEAEPLERVRRPDGTEVLVPRSRAAGMESAPSPREAPGAYGQDRVGRATQYVEELGPIVASGRATPEQLQRYGTAVTTYQNRVSENGTLVSQPLPPNVPGLDWVAQRYPGFRFQPDASVSPAASGGTVAPAAGQPGAAPPTIGDASPAVPALPAVGGSPPIPGAGGGVQRPDGTMEAGTRRQIEEAAVASQDRISRLTGIERSYDPQMQTYGNRWSNMWSALRERSGAQLSPQERHRLTQYTQGRASALENLNRTIQETTGAAMSEGEAARITATMPNPGTGLFDGDSPTEFQAKLQRAVNSTRNAIIRQNYALSRGLNPTSTGIELDAIPRLYEQRGREIEAEIRQGARDADAAQVRQQVRVRLRQEFGI